MYLTFQDYTQYGGTLDEVPFNNFCFEAQCIIDWYTFDRLKNETYENLSESVKRCMYAIINLLQIKSSAIGSASGGEGEQNQSAGLISSQSNDGVSVSYNVLSSQQVLDYYNQDVQQIMHRYLNAVTNSLGRKVLYRGLYPGE